MTDEILFAPFEFMPLKCNSSSLVNIAKGQGLTIIRKIDFYKVGKTFITQQRIPERRGVVTIRLSTKLPSIICSAGIISEIYNQAKNEYKQTKTIQGFELLILTTLEKCWVSHYDMKYLLENQ